MKRPIFFALVTVLLLVLTAVTGCEQTTGETTPQPTVETAVTVKPAGETTQPTEEPAQEPAVEILMVFPGASATDEEMVLSALNEKSLEEINTTYAIDWVPWGDWGTVSNTRLASGDVIDGMLVFETGLAQMWGTDAFLPLNEWISEEKTPGLLSGIPLQAFEDMSINGEYTCFPSIVTYQNWYVAANIRKDLREEYGLDTIDTLEGLEEYLTLVAENESEMVPAEALGTLQHIIGREIGYAFFAGPNYLTGGIAMVNPDTNIVSNYLESEHFLYTIELTRRWYEKGIFTPDSNTGNAPSLVSGLSGFATHDITMADYWNNKNTLEGVEFERVIINPNALGFRDMWANNLVCVPCSSENPDRVVRWVDWLFGDTDHYLTLLYGIEGVHWEYAEGSDEVIQVPEGKDASDYPAWCMWQWAQGSLDVFTPYETESTIELLKEFRDPDTEVVVSPTLGFYVDLTPVQDEWDLMQEVWLAYGQPLVQGRLPIEGNYETLLEEMNNAGADKFIAEMQRQYDAWRANK